MSTVQRAIGESLMLGRSIGNIFRRRYDLTSRKVKLILPRREFTHIRFPIRDIRFILG